MLGGEELGYYLVWGPGRWESPKKHPKGGQACINCM